MPWYLPYTPTWDCLIKLLLGPSSPLLWNLTLTLIQSALRLAFSKYASYLSLLTYKLNLPSYSLSSDRTLTALPSLEP